MPTYAKSTHDELIDVLLSDLPQAELKKLPPQALMDWVFRAEERICRLTSVREEFVLRYSSGVSDYPLQNRAPITAATNATPIVLTSAAHGVSNHKRFYVFGAQGNPAANGIWFASDVSTNNATLNPGAYISAVAAITGGLKVSTETAHGFTNGATITIADMNSVPIPNGDYVITLIDASNFTIPYSPVDPTYSGGGVAYRKNASVGNGAYTGGGRLWLDSELPTYINKVIGGSGLYGGYPYKVRGYTIDDLDKERTVYQCAYPRRAAIFTKGGVKYIRLDPIPQISAEVTIYGQVQITPKDHYTDTSSMNVHLASEYDPMILDFMKARAYERLQDPKMMEYYTREFTGRVNEHNANQTPTLIDIVYK